MQNDKEKTSVGEKINEFVEKNRKGIFITIGVLVFLFVGLIAFLYFSDSMNKKAIAEAEDFNIRFEEILMLSSLDVFYSSDVNAFLDEVRTFAEKSRGFAGSRAWSIVATIHSIREEWPLAEEAWRNCARVGSRTYLAPIALFNAAVAAEEQGKIEQAIELLQQSISHSFEFPAAPRAQFSIGRLYEQLGDFPAAIEAYRAVSINWPNMTALQNLARSRIIAIEIR
jgi:tetratricopeptide (TPR) repeat protein